MFKEEFMKKRTIKLLSLTLVVLMTFFAVGCDMEAIFAPLSEIQTNVPDGTGDLIDDTELVSGVATEKETNVFTGDINIGENETEKEIPVVDFDFEGEEIYILAPAVQSIVQSWSPEPDDILGEYVLMRNAAVGEKLNLSINFEFVSFSDQERGKEMLRMMIMDDITQDLHYYDIVSASPDVLASATIRSCFANLNNKEEFPWFDFTLPCWNQTLVEDCTLNDRLYYISGATEISSMLDTYVVWHNKTLYDLKKEENDFESFKELMRDGFWTYDELYEWSQRFYEDSNGVPGQQADDSYGVAFEGNENYPCAEAFRAAWDLNIADTNPEWQAAVYKDMNKYTERAENALVMVKKLFAAQGTTVNATAEYFMTGNNLFYISTLDAFEGVSEINFDADLLLMPKYDAEQENYLSYTANPIVTAVLNHAESSIPTKSEAVCVALQLLAEESFMEGKFSNLDDQVPFAVSEDDIWTLGQIFQNMQLTLGTVYASQLEDVDSIWITALNEGNNVAALYSERENIYVQALNTLNEWFGNRG